MPSPATTNLPHPKSWDEFEDICADVLKRMWKDPYVARNGRSGQRQHSVDSYGYPEHLGGPPGGRIAGAQCKLTNELDFDTVKAEVEGAQAFKPVLSEYVLMTTAPRDAKLQESIRAATWPFRVHAMFWEDISLELSGYEDLLQKHFPGWVSKTTSKEQVLERLMLSTPDDFDYDDRTGVYVHKRDLNLHLKLDRTSEDDRDFEEPWVKVFPNPRATVQVVHIVYAGTCLSNVYCAWVDGARYLIPYPKSRADLFITPFKYHIGRILNHHWPGYGFDFALKRAGFVVKDD